MNAPTAFPSDPVEVDIAVLYNAECEQALLGAILMSEGAALDRVDGIVSADDFYDPIHAGLFQQFTEARKDGRGVSLGLALAALGGNASKPLVPGLTVGQYVARLSAEATTTIGAPDYAKTIRDFSDRRRTLGVANSLRDGIAAAVSPVEIAALGIEQLDAIVSARPGKRPASSWIGSAAERSVERMTWGMENPGKLSGVSWGLRELDAKTNGLRRGELIVVAGRPGMGKSGLAVSCARQTAKAGNDVLIFSLEMGDISLADRALSDACFDPREPIEYFAIARGGLSDMQAERVAIAAREMRNLPIKIDETAGLTVSQIAARARKHAIFLERQGRTLDLIVVDHLHLVRASDRYSGNRVSEVTEISGSLKALAKELDAPVMALAQLSRKVEDRDGLRPKLADLRDSGAIEQDADLVLLVFREAYYLENTVAADPTAEDKRLARLFEVRNTMEAIVAKQRNGPIGTVALFFNAPCNAVRSIARAA